jgi:hypothetical protein
VHGKDFHAIQKDQVHDHWFPIWRMFFVIVVILYPNEWSDPHVCPSLCMSDVSQVLIRI